MIRKLLSWHLCCHCLIVFHCLQMCWLSGFGSFTFLVSFHASPSIKSSISPTFLLFLFTKEFGKHQYLLKWRYLCGLWLMEESWLMITFKREGLIAIFVLNGASRVKGVRNLWITYSCTVMRHWIFGINSFVWLIPFRWYQARVHMILINFCSFGGKKKAKVL